MVRVGLNPEGTCLLIRFDYNPRLVELTKQLPGRRFNKLQRAWVVPLTKELVDELPGRFPGVAVHVEPDVRAKLDGLNQKEQDTLKLKDVNGKIEMPKDMIFPKAQPLDHQRRALGLVAVRPTFALFMEMGTGKTFVILALLRWLEQHNALTPSIIACPASILNVWQDQAGQHQPDLKVTVLSGSMEKRKQLLRDGYLSGSQVFVINFEGFWRMEAELAKIPWKCMVIDESTRIKNRTTNQTKSILRVGQRVPRRYILTGTPMPNSPLELYSQFLFLDPTIFGNHFYAFRDRYAVMGGYQGYQVVSWRNTHELMDKLQRNSFRVLKRDCLDLPDKIYETIRLDLDGDQKTAYKQLCDDLVTEVSGQQVTAAVLVSKLTKLREILAGFVKADSGELRRFKNHAKLEALKEIIEDMPPKAKMVIWGQFHEEMNIVQEYLRGEGHEYVRLDGSVPIPARGDLVRKFQEGPSCRFFIGQQHAGGLGITLTAGSYCVFLTNDYSPEIRLQAEDRLHRIGQTNKVTYYDLVCKSTIDVAVAAALRRKQRLSEIITGDNISEALQGDL